MYICISIAVAPNLFELIGPIAILSQFVDAVHKMAAVAYLHSHDEDPCAV